MWWRESSGWRGVSLEPTTSTRLKGTFVRGAASPLLDLPRYSSSRRPLSSSALCHQSGFLSRFGVSVYQGSKVTFTTPSTSGLCLRYLTAPSELTECPAFREAPRSLTGVIDLPGLAIAERRGGNSRRVRQDGLVRRLITDTNCMPLLYLSRVSK